MQSPTITPSHWNFSSHLRKAGKAPLVRDHVRTVQVNVGKVCNQACLHCHVEAGPKRTESMSEATAGRILELLEESSADVLDITGGAPELNPSFRKLVSRGRSLGLNVIDRCNLSILFEPGMEDLAEFLASQEVHIVASLPCYTEETVDAQRGLGTYGKSIEALRLLTQRGYGRPGSGLVIDLVYNPSGAFLPPAQDDLEQQYRAKLEKLDIAFSSLLTLSNIPIGRFAHSLERGGELAPYMNLLADNFNAATVSAVMCRSQVNIGWDGTIYDCDFNQMLGLACLDADGVPRTVHNLVSFNELGKTRIKTASHCLGCTAGAGSSCGGALEPTRE